jgi:hypothetical protein
MTRLAGDLDQLATKSQQTSNIEVKLNGGSF